MGKKYYETLGVALTATYEEIKKAYKKLARIYHPDKSKSEDTQEKFKEIQEAYNALIVTKKPSPEAQKNKEDSKSKKNESGTSKNTQTNGTERNNGWNSGKPGTSSAKPKAPENQYPPIHYDLFVTLEEIDSGCIKTENIGRIVTKSDGSQIKETNEFKIEVKPGCKSSTKHSFPRAGDVMPSKVPADIVFVIKVKPHSIFTRVGNDLKCTAKITNEQANGDKTIQVPTLQGQKISIEASGRVLKASTMRRFKGRGLPLLDDPNQRGDLLVNFEIV